MTRVTRIEYLAAKDAYLTRLLRIIDSMIADETNHPDDRTPLPKSGVSVGESRHAQPREGDSLEGTLNANLHPCMLPFEDWPCDLRHKSHPYCD